MNNKIYGNLNRQQQQLPVLSRTQTSAVAMFPNVSSATVNVVPAVVRTMSKHSTASTRLSDIPIMKPVNSDSVAPRVNDTVPSVTKSMSVVVAIVMA